MDKHRDIKQKSALVFPSFSDLSNFKRQLQCLDFYIDRETLTLIGTFSKKDIEDATTHYAAKMTLSLEE